MKQRFSLFPSFPSLFPASSLLPSFPPTSSLNRHSNKEPFKSCPSQVGASQVIPHNTPFGTKHCSHTSSPFSRAGAGGCTLGWLDPESPKSMLRQAPLPLHPLSFSDLGGPQFSEHPGMASSAPQPPNRGSTGTPPAFSLTTVCGVGRGSPTLLT